MLRLFTALDPPQEIKQQLLQLRRSMPGARWQNIDQMHITTNFLGEVDKSLLPEIKQALTSVKAESLELNIIGVDYFGSSRQPRILYAKVELNSELIKLNKLINNELLAIGVKTEKQKFRPHITLARLKRTSYQSVGQFIQLEALFKTDSFKLDEFHLFSSKLHPEGSQYFIEESFPLDSSNRSVTT